MSYLAALEGMRRLSQGYLANLSGDAHDPS